MLNLSSALGRLVLAGRELARLSGFSSRVTGLIDVIDDVNRAVYKKGPLPKSSEKPSARTTNSAAAAAAAVATVTVESRERIDSPVRNAGVAGVNLTAEQTTAWTKSGSPTLEAAACTGITSARFDSEKAPPIAAQREEATGLLSTDVAGEGARSSKENQTGALPMVITGHPELAPEAGFASTKAKGEVAVSMGSDLRGDDDEARLAESYADLGRSALKSSGSMLSNKCSVIEFIDVPIVTPTGEVLIEALSFKVSFMDMGQSPAFRRSLYRYLGALSIAMFAQVGGTPDSVVYVEAVLRKDRATVWHDM